MQSLGQSGKIAPDDLVWREGMQTKIAASQYKGLLPSDSAVLSGANESGVVHLKTGNHRRSSKVSSRKLTTGEIFQIGWQAQNIVFTNRISMVFLTLVFLFTCIISAGLIITFPLIPIFCMGYALNVIRVRQQGEIQLDDFIFFYSEAGHPFLMYLNYLRHSL